MSKDFFGEEEELITDEDNLFILNDEDGNEIKFEFLDLIELENENYVVLYPIENENEEVVILRVQETEGDQDEYLSVDEKTLQAVYAIFKEKFKDELIILNNMKFDNWKEIKLNEIVKPIKLKTYIIDKQKDGDIPIYGATNINKPVAFIENYSIDTEETDDQDIKNYGVYS